MEALVAGGSWFAGTGGAALLSPEALGDPLWETEAARKAPPMEDLRMLSGVGGHASVGRSL